MEVLRSVQDLRAWRRAHAGPLGFVPTMGALHAGHLTLVQNALQQCGNCIVSIFVNPTQFNDPNDLALYPRPIENDLAVLRTAGVTAVFLPNPEDIYADEYRFEVREKVDSEILCGPTRPGHFAGVLTVVLKLFLLVRPTHAFFGEKDYQQLRLIREMTRAFFLELEVVAVPTVREPDGLAMSSRNVRLTREERENAPLIYRVLKKAPDMQSARRELERAGFRVDYVEEHWGRRFVAAFLGKVRLIDNVEI